MQHLSLAEKDVIRRFGLEDVLEIASHHSRAVAAVTAGICCDCRDCRDYVLLP